MAAEEQRTNAEAGQAAAEAGRAAAEAGRASAEAAHQAMRELHKAEKTRLESALEAERTARETYGLSEQQIAEVLDRASRGEDV